MKKYINPIIKINIFSQEISTSQDVSPTVAPSYVPVIDEQLSTSIANSIATKVYSVDFSDAIKFQ